MSFLQLPNIQPTDSVARHADKLQDLESLSLNDFIHKISNQLVTFAINLAIAIFVFYVGKLIIRKINNIITNILVRRDADKSLATFILSLVKMVLYFLLIVTVIGILGIETSSFIALFASAGVAIGMALSGTLQNFAGGVLILLLKPYKVGDYIEAQGFAGYVTEVQVFHTIIRTYDNKSIIIPNGGLSTSSINNWSREEYRRVEWNVAISYGDNVDDARNAILAIFNSDDRVVRDYIENDRQMRMSEETGNQENNIELDSSEIKKHGFFWRLFHRQKVRMAARIDSIKQAEELRLPSAAEKTLRSPSVSVDSLGDSSVQLKARAWTRNEFYWSLYYDINERIYNELPKSGINFPFPQLDVHMQQK